MTSERDDDDKEIKVIFLKYPGNPFEASFKKQLNDISIDILKGAVIKRKNTFIYPFFLLGTS